MRIMKKMLDKLNNIFYINNRYTLQKGQIYMSDITTYIIKNIDKNTWKRFRAKCLLDGYNSASELLHKFINDYVGTKNDK